MLRSFIQVTSLVFTLEAAIFLAKSNLGLSTETIAEISSTYWDHNTDMVKNLAQQRADAWIGVVFLLVAFFLQMLNTLWPMRLKDLDVHRGAAILAVVFSAVLFVCALFLSRMLASNTESRVKHILERNAPSGQVTPEKDG